MKKGILYFVAGASVLSLVFSICAFIIASNKYSLSAIDNVSILTAIFTLLVTLLIGWQIVSFMNSKEELSQAISKFNLARKENENRISKMEKQISDELMGISMIIKSFDYDNLVYRINYLLACYYQQNKYDKAPFVSGIINKLITQEFNNLVRRAPDYMNQPYPWSIDQMDLFIQNIDHSIITPEAYQFLINKKKEIEHINKYL